MPTRSVGDDIRELGLPARAVSALARAGITTADDLAALTRRELAAVPGLGPGLITAIRAVVPEPVDDEGPPSPAIPSFESLRTPQRRSALDVLLPEPPPATSQEPPATATPAPRPPEYADLCRLGVHLLRAAAAVPWRLARWSVREPVQAVRRLAGR
jgi:hypothetical protein